MIPAHMARIESIVEEAEDVRSFAFRFVGEAPATHLGLPGQFAPFRFRIGDGHHERFYAISSLPQLGEAPCFTVKRKPDGLVSGHCMDRLAPGDLVAVGPARGGFRLQPGNAPVVFLAGGIGIAPIFPLIRFALLCTQRPVAVVLFERNAARQAFLPALQGLAVRHRGRMSLHGAFGAGPPAMDRALAGVLDPTSAQHVYMCGPAGFLDAAGACVRAAGHPASRIFANDRDAYIAGYLAQPPHAAAAAALAL
ncbi:ferredoxin--NADP reductase [Xanthobacter pseudotagetidis]|uniref:ferredoxin--NADP reductase n=1 Tax=Xanthobacter pseudotagetidis TaxID=3119911 RepID=UPI00372C541F